MGLYRLIVNTKLKNKITFAAFILILFCLILSMFFVAITVKRQHQQASHQVIENTFRIFNNELTHLKSRCLSEIKQIVPASDLGNKLKYILDFQEDGFGMIQSTVEQMVKDALKEMLSKNIADLTIYNLDNRLLAFIKIQDKKVNAGIYDVKTGEYQVCGFSVGASLGSLSWEPIPKISFPTQIEPIQGESVKIRKGFNHALSLTAYMPVTASFFNESTEQFEPRKVALLVSAQQVESDFLKKLAGYTGTDINIFIDEQLTVGTLPRYTFLQKPEGEKRASSLEKNGKLVFEELDVANEIYIQGISPLQENNSVVGHIAVLKPFRDIQSNTLQMIRLQLIVSLVCLGLTIPIMLLFSKMLTLPLLKILDSLKNISEGEGDLTQRIEIHRKDEVGELASYFNMFIQTIQMMVEEITGRTKTLSISSSQLSELSVNMNQDSESVRQMFRQTVEMATRMSGGMNEISSEMNEGARNINLVASATEEMTVTLNEISRSTEEASDISEQAVAKTKEMSDLISSLGESARDISKVTETINDISDQTNLLALNATIEAARAGESGRGFAVVAKEIKELAQQTAEATHGIKQKIEDIQSSTAGTIAFIGDIAEVINKMAEIASAIDRGVEEQLGVAKEVSINISRLSSGMEKVDGNISDNAQSSGKIAADMNQVEAFSDQASEISTQVQSNAEELSRLAEEVQALVGRFKT